MTTLEASEILKVHLNTVAKYCRQGKLKARRHMVGRSGVEWEVLATPADLLAFQRLQSTRSQRATSLWATRKAPVSTPREEAPRTRLVCIANRDADAPVPDEVTAEIATRKALQAAALAGDQRAKRRLTEEPYRLLRWQRDGQEVL